MVAFREDRGQPDRCQPAVPQPLVVAVVAQVAVQNFGKVQFLRSILSKTAGQRVTAEPRSGRLPTYADT